MITPTFLALALQAPAAPGFDDLFTGRTLRVDYVHAGHSAGAGEERIALDGLRLEGPWPGSRTQRVDESGLGKYRFEVVDAATQRAIFARGFSSIYGEWETTGEAADGVRRAFDESQRFPEPRAPVQLVLKERGRDGVFHELWTARVDPSDRAIDRSPVPARGQVLVLSGDAPPERAVDLLVMGDGYVDAGAFERDARRLTGALFAVEPFARRRADFVVRALFVESPERGVSDPRAGRWVASPLGLSYDAFGSERYVLTYRNRELRELAAQVPYDALVLLADSRKYGGGGIYDLWCTAAARSAQSEYLVVHELGHSFAGLGDEYYTSQVAYEDLEQEGAEPWEPNVTALADPERLKWRDLVTPGTPLPTPWDQEAFDRASLAYQRRRAELREAGAEEEEMEALFEEVKVATSALLAAEPHAGAVGAFRGAGYRAEGLYRPAADCLMFTRNPRSFCAVCERAVERAIDRWTR